MAGDFPLIVILGPTAVGKTRLALDLARRFEGEIINADSRQVYRYMDIGTAKPTPEQLTQAVHHLLDIVDPDDHLALAQYQRMAYAVINDIHRRGKLPLLVGGTGQYITAVTEGWRIPEVPPNEGLRRELEVFAAEHGSLALHERLTNLDPEAASRIHHHNVRRVVRALEVCLETGQPISELQRKTPPPYRLLQYGLTMERKRLYEQADSRFDDMMAVGFLDEVRELLDRGYSPSLPSMSGIGYAQLAGHLVKGVPLDEAITAAKHLTHDFIRRQYTWFRGHDSGILWHNREEMDLSDISAAVMRWLHP
ncbi:MAG: tRNA (adenosine(37)-N6)-dimethylallyltransferase MiaA [Anaerolineaceae bacterium]|nr:tRNA (adenosine(37)-N6)-dimethylallyltransferase MiaA [Anaerolineaceae bacterium]